MKRCNYLTVYNFSEHSCYVITTDLNMYYLCMLALFNSLHWLYISWDTRSDSQLTWYSHFEQTFVQFCCSECQQWDYPILSLIARCNSDVRIEAQTRVRKSCLALHWLYAFTERKHFILLLDEINQRDLSKCIIALKSYVLRHNL